MTMGNGEVTREMMVRTSHISRFLLKGTVRAPSTISIDGTPPAVLRAFPRPNSIDRTFYYFKPDGFHTGAKVVIRSISERETLDFRFSVNLITNDDAASRRQLCIGLHSAPDWAIDNVDISGNTVELSGWVMQGIGETVEMFINGQSVDVSFTERADIDQGFAHLAPHRCWSAFAARGQFSSNATDLTFQLSDPKAIVYRYSLMANRRFPLPEPSRICRVNGPLSQSGFNRAGYSHYHIISSLAHDLMQLRRGPIDILDWGCGCGGLARFFLQDKHFNYTGCDIDADNLTWCQRNLDSERFFMLPLSPPESVPFSVPFNVIFGISVISHLSPTNIKIWLEWLANILTDDGHLILSTLSTQAISKLPPDQAYSIIRDRFGFNQITTEIGDIVRDQQYYGVAHQTPDFLATLIEPNLEIIYHIPSALSHQDIFVIKRKTQST
jgi:2-polyprenyl-3-methyl-5-hydroxy-6-metoxy-1,4-benzoquinol methylase